MRYFITFACYGSHVHGAQRGSVDRNHNLPDSRTLEIDSNRAEIESEAMAQAPYLLDGRARTLVCTLFKKFAYTADGTCSPHTCELIMCMSWWSPRLGLRKS